MKYSALIGFPTEKSLSTEAFNLYEKNFNLDYAHIKINIHPKNDKLEESIKALQKINFCGFNVTQPYKLEIIKHLHQITPFAQRIGAVNTVIMHKNQFFGDNTDAFGAISSIEKAIDMPIQKNFIATILGTGGAAKAIAGGLISKCKHIYVCYRKPMSIKTQDFVHRFGKQVTMVEYTSELFSKVLCKSTIICNATPVGSYYCTDSDILTETHFKSFNNKKIIFDAVYQPIKTNLLTQAAHKGHIVADGLDMMLYQGSKAFQLWTGLNLNNNLVIKTKSEILQRDRL